MIGNGGSIVQPFNRAFLRKLIEGSRSTISDLWPNYPEMTSANHILTVAPSIQITTAYDNISNRRLIVDGLKRAIGIQQLINKDIPIPESIIMECYGKIVRCIFPIEFMHVR